VDFCEDSDGAPLILAADGKAVAILNTRGLTADEVRANAEFIRNVAQQSSYLAAAEPAFALFLRDHVAHGHIVIKTDGYSLTLCCQSCTLGRTSPA